MDSIRSPLFYVGDKYKLMPQLKQLFPKNIDSYYEPFLGGGSSFLNTTASRYVVNDNNEWIIKIHKELCKYVSKEEKLLSKIYSVIEEYGLSCSYQGKTAPEELKKKYPKTYYAKFNKIAYERLRSDFNKDKKDILKLYILLIYGFNHMIRFNGAGDFNLPVGDVDFNKNVFLALHNYLNICKEREIAFKNEDFRRFIGSINNNESNTYVYCDPPYLISASEYNKFWTEKEENDLYMLLDKLDSKGVKFGLSNLLEHKGSENKILREWSKKYFIYNIKSNYISFNDNTIKTGSKEIFVTNYSINNQKGDENGTGKV